MPLIEHTENTEIPPELDRWSWGAFILNWIWGIGNSTYIALLMFVPFVNIVMLFVLGAKGNKWAWKNRVWRDVEHFRSTQRKWSIAGALVLFLTPALIFAMLFGIMSLLKNADAYKMTMRELRANQPLIEKIGSPVNDGFFPTGSVNVSGSGGNAEFQISISGNKGDATAISKAVKINGNWTLILLYVNFSAEMEPLVIINTAKTRIPKPGAEI